MISLRTIAFAVAGLGAASATASAADGAALPRLLQRAAPLNAAAVPAWPAAVRTPTLAFKAGAWPPAITTPGLSYGRPGWSVVPAPPLAFKGAAWPPALATTALVYRGVPVRAPLALQPAAAVSSPLLTNRSRP